MTQSKINLYNHTLVLDSQKLLFEGKVIYDFEDRYGNLSSFGVEAQFQLLQKVVDLIYQSGLTMEGKAEILIILGSILKVMSARNTPSTLLVIGESVTNSIYANVMTLFGNENRLYEFCHNPQMMFGNAENITSLLTDASYNMESLPDNHFSLIVINFDSVKYVLPEILDQCDRLITNNGKLVIYGSGMQRSGLFDIAAQEDVNLYRLNTERAVLCMDITDKKSTSEEVGHRKQIFDMIDPLLKELSTKFKYVLTAHPSHSEWHQTIDDAILLLSRTEEIIAKYFVIFENKDLKYETNEVKNALLDLKYEAYLNRPHFDYFHSALIDLYHHWVENIR
jgi:hypothetical protein